MKFLEDVNNPNNEPYLFEVDGEIQGIIELIFCKKECNIYQFAVFERLKGLGTILYREVLDVIKERKSKKLHCGAHMKVSKFSGLRRRA